MFTAGKLLLCLAQTEAYTSATSYMSAALFLACYSLLLWP
jgi:hypothetical protein